MTDLCTSARFTLEQQEVSLEIEIIFPAQNNISCTVFLFIVVNVSIITIILIIIIRRRRIT